MIRGRKLVFDNDTSNNEDKLLKGHKIISKHKKVTIDLSTVKPVLETTNAGDTFKKPKQIKVTNEGVKEKEEKKPYVYNDGKSKAPATIFFIIILVIGFYLIYDQFYKVKTYDSTDTETSIKIKEARPYVYIDNSSVILTDNTLNEAYYEETIIINMNTTAMTDLQTKLDSETKAFKSSYVYRDKNSTVTCTSEECTTGCNSTTSDYDTDAKVLSGFTYRTYQISATSNYYIVNALDHTISTCSDNLKDSMTSYILDTDTGKIVYEDAIYEVFSTTKDNLISNIIKNNSEYADDINSNTTFTLTIDNGYLGINFIKNNVIVTLYSTIIAK